MAVYGSQSPIPRAFDNLYDARTERSVGFKNKARSLSHSHVLRLLFNGCFRHRLCLLSRHRRNKALCNGLREKRLENATRVWQYCGTESGNRQAPRLRFRPYNNRRLRYRLTVCDTMQLYRLIIWYMYHVIQVATCHRILYTQVVQHEYLYIIIIIYSASKYVIFGAHDCCDTQLPPTVGGKLPSRVDEPLLYYRRGRLNAMRVRRDGRDGKPPMPPLKLQLTRYFVQFSNVM